MSDEIGFRGTGGGRDDRLLGGLEARIGHMGEMMSDMRGRLEGHMREMRDDQRRALDEIKRETGESRRELHQAVTAELKRLDDSKASKDDVLLVKRIVFAACGIILAGFMAALVGVAMVNRSDTPDFPTVTQSAPPPNQRR